jgi:hypothetical protein
LKNTTLNHSFHYISHLTKIQQTSDLTDSHAKRTVVLFCAQTCCQ